MRKDILAAAKRVVVKVGSNVLSDDEGRLSEKVVGDLARQIAALRHGGREMILVTSGAISAGMARMGIRQRPKSLPQLQAAAAVGQGHLMQLYANRFHAEGVEVAQILLTADDLKARHRHLNARNTIIALIERGIIPIINENDTVSVEEIKFGDNDCLSALVANLVMADLLIMLTDAPGLMTVDPKKGEGELIRELACVGPDIEACALGAGSAIGTGGMASKLAAVKMVLSSGEAAVIADGRDGNILRRLFSGEEAGTFFCSRAERLRGRKRWIAFFLKPRGKLTIDDGAERALVKGGKSLLPTGIREVSGDFKAGDTVSILTLRSREIARGLSNYSSAELRKIRGLKTAEIHSVLGRKDYDEVVHRDNLVLMESPAAEDGTR